MKRPIRALLLATTIIATPGLAAADPVSLVGLAATAAGTALSGALGGGVLATILGALVTGAIGFAGNLLFGPKLDTASQAATRSREFDPHPPFRFAFGSFPLEGSVVFHYAPDGDGRYYVAYLLNSVPSDSITKIEINDGQDLPFENGGVSVDLSDTSSDIYDMQEGARVSDGTGYGTFDGKARVRMWIGLGEHTQAPQAWLDEIGPAGDNILKTTDVWKGATVVFVTFRKGPDLEMQRTWGLGVPPPLTFYGKWSKLYDPRKDPTSGVAGASGTHDRDDRTTWEWSDNAALCALMLVRHDFALGFDDEMIPIQQYADAADDCGSVSVTGGNHNKSVTFDDTGDVVARSAGTDPGAGQIAWDLNGSLTVTGGNLEIRGSDSDGTVTADETVRFGAYFHLPSIGLDPDLTYGFDSVSTLVSAGSGLLERQIIAVGDGIGQTSEADQLAYSMPPNAGTITVVHDTGFVSDAGLGPINVTGPFVSHTNYKGAANGTAEVWSDHTYSFSGVATSVTRFAADGLIVIDQRELSLLDPVLACMAGHIDPTDGLLGIRAGVWKAPTDTLSQPIGDEVEIIGARDAGFDTVRAKFIGSHREWEETDGPGYQLRAGARVHPLQLPLVSNVHQAARLEKIAALRAEPNRIINSVWDGRELNRRIGERVNFALPGFARAESTFVITAKTPITREVDDGFEVSADLTLTEDLEATYAWDAATDFTHPGTFDSPVQSSDDLAAPTSVTLEQSDYRSAAGATARLKITTVISQAVADVANNLRIEVTDGSGYTHLVDIEVSSGTLSYVAYLKPAEVGVTYTGRARAESGFLGVSAYTTSGSLTIVTPVLDYDSADYSAEYA